MIAAILLAGGHGSRMKGVTSDKILARVGNRSLFRWSLEAFASSDAVDLAVIVHRDEAQRNALAEDISSSKNLNTIWVQGGKERSDSVRNGLEALPQATDAVFIHDCARPLIRPETLRTIRNALTEFPAVALAHPMTDTLKIAEPTEQGEIFVTKPLDRTQLWAMETPQAFDFDLIRRAHAKAQDMKLPLTDDISAIEALDHPVHLIQAGYPNPKVTSQEDLLLIESLLPKNNLTAL
jgi:2-C-methyl-D-erythritol 4-phosphate cytidylyltransferase